MVNQNINDYNYNTIPKRDKRSIHQSSHESINEYNNKDEQLHSCLTSAFKK